ncbi:precorrin-8X methylmutase, partial [Salmonella enterica]|uniref:precorrin-8X methylmutase n=1 Tax=Salmonella enterica TaxID=28901 RepID=UPI003F1A1FE0
VGVQEGFVGAAESKVALTHSQIPEVASLGSQGGSNQSDAIVNALLYHLRESCLCSFLLTRRSCTTVKS